MENHFEFKQLSNINDTKERYNLVITFLKNRYQVNHVANYDIMALSTFFRKSDFGYWEDYERIQTDIEESEYKPQIVEFKKVKVLVIGFNDLTKYFDPSFKNVKGYNCSEVQSHNKGTFYDRKNNVIMPFDSESEKYIHLNIQSIILDRNAWLEFNKVKHKISTEKVEILEPIYMHFLEVLPPIYGNGCFYCSEPVNTDKNGSKIYHKLTKNNNKYFIELSIIEN